MIVRSTFVYDNVILILALNEFAAFDEAIGKALSMINLEETLVLVTADHRQHFKSSEIKIEIM